MLSIMLASFTRLLDCNELKICSCRPSDKKWRGPYHILHCDNKGDPLVFGHIGVISRGGRGFKRRESIQKLARCEALTDTWSWSGAED